MNTPNEIIFRGNTDTAKLEFLTNVEVGMKLVNGFKFATLADMANLAGALGVTMEGRNGDYFIKSIDRSKVIFALMAILGAARKKRDEAQKEIDAVELAIKQIKI